MVSEKSSLISKMRQPLLLIGERDPFMRQALTKALGEHYRVEFADSGRKLIEVARLKKPALIILEVLLPEMDGLQVCRQLREDPDLAKIPVLVFSLLDVKERALQAGACAFLGKPLRKSLLVETIQGILEQHSENEESGK